MKRIILIVLLITVLAIAGCTRSASRPPTGDATATVGEGTSQIPFPTPESGGEAGVPDEMSTAVAGGFATQTAVAAGEQPMQDTTVPEATSVVEPTTAPATATPTQKPAGTGSGSSTSVDCTSPYKVKQGDWVWDIGRRCNIHPDSIIAANNLRWPYIIYPGDMLVLPSNAPAFPGP